MNRRILSIGGAASLAWLTWLMKVREYVCAENNPAEPDTPGPDDARYDRPDPRLKTQI